MASSQGEEVWTLTGWRSCEDKGDRPEKESKLCVPSLGILACSMGEKNCSCWSPLSCSELVEASPETTENTGHLWKEVCCRVSQESDLQDCVELQGFYGRVRKRTTEHRLRFWKREMGIPSRILHEQGVGWRRVGSKRFWLWRSMHGCNCWTNPGDFCLLQRSRDTKMLWD